MSTIGFSDKEEDVINLSTRTLQLILDRAVPRISDSSEAEDLRTCIYSDGVSFDLFEPGTRERVTRAFREGTLQLKQELEAGEEPLPDFGAGNIPKLDEIVALIDRFLPAGGNL